MASKENFFKAHWDWLVAGAGLLALAASAAMFVSRLGLSPEDGALRCEMRLKAAKPAHEGVPAADMTIFQSVFRVAKAPPTMVEIDAKKGSFLASETRIVCKAEKDAAKDGKPVKGCGRPIPMDAKVCPYCGVPQDTGVTKEEEGVRRMREWSARYGVDLVLHPDADTDKDGFTDMEEYEYALKQGVSCDPKDPTSHPDYLESLFVDGEMKQTLLPFYLQTVSPVPNGWRFNFRDTTKKNAYGQAMVYSVLKDEEIGKTGFTAVKYEKLQEERVVPGSKGKLKKKVDVSTVELVRKGDGKKIMAKVNERRVPVDKQVTLVFRRGGEKRFTVKQGDEIELFSRKYKVIALGDDPKNPEVKVLDLIAKKESVVTAGGKKE